MNVLPPFVDWDEDLRFEWAERSALVADGCKLPQRCEEADRRAEQIVRRRWAARLAEPVESHMREP